MLNLIDVGLVLGSLQFFHFFFLYFFVLSSFLLFFPIIHFIFSLLFFFVVYFLLSFSLLALCLFFHPSFFFLSLFHALFFLLLFYDLYNFLSRVQRRRWRRWIVRGGGKFGREHLPGLVASLSLQSQGTDLTMVWYQRSWCPGPRSD